MVRVMVMVMTTTLVCNLMLPVVAVMSFDADGHDKGMQIACEHQRALQSQSILPRFQKLACKLQRVAKKLFH
jgi:hypothetical protein